MSAYKHQDHNITEKGKYTASKYVFGTVMSNFGDPFVYFSDYSDLA